MKFTINIDGVIHLEFNWSRKISS